MASGQLEDWRKGVERFLNNLDSKVSASTVLRTVLQNHSYVNATKYLPNSSFRHSLQTQNPSQSAHVMIDILNRFVHDLHVCKTETWDSEIGYDVKELLEVQIDQQFSIIKNDIVKACERCRDTYTPRTDADNCTSFQQLGAELHSLWFSAKLEVLKFSATRKEQFSHRLKGTAPATSLRELYLRNALTVAPPWKSKHHELKGEILYIIKQARQLFKNPDSSWRMFFFHDFSLRSNSN